MPYRKKRLKKMRNLLKWCVEGKVLIVVIPNCPTLSRMNGCEKRMQTEKNPAIVNKRLC